MDINLHYGNDDSNSSDIPVLTRPVDLFFQEIELAIKIWEGSIWQRPKGLDIRKYILNKYINTNHMLNEIKSFVASECENAKNFDWDCLVRIVKEKNNLEIIVIDFKVNITINGNRETLTNQFLISK